VRDAPNTYVAGRRVYFLRPVKKANSANNGKSTAMSRLQDELARRDAAAAVRLSGPRIAVFMMLTHVLLCVQSAEHEARRNSAPPAGPNDGSTKDTTDGKRRGADAGQIRHTESDLAPEELLEAQLDAAANDDDAEDDDSLPRSQGDEAPGSCTFVLNVPAPSAHR
jgi:hypothetical protein